MIKNIYLLIFLSCTFAQGKHIITQLCSEPKIIVIKNFLSHKECNHIIKTAQPKLQRSTVVDKNKEGTVDSRRTSHGFWFDDTTKNSIIHDIEQRIATLTNMPIKNGEALHVLHYGVGGEYQPHYDYFDETTSGGADCLRNGGQRVATVIMYLNNPEKGGETHFPLKNISVTPKKGDAVLFYNCKPDGNVDPQTLHAGTPVQKGEKWIMTKWIRKNEFK